LISSETGQTLHPDVVSHLRECLDKQHKDFKPGDKMFSGCINLLARHKITTLERLEALINAYRGGKSGMPDKEFRHMMHACFGEYVLFRNKLKADRAVPGSVAARAAAINASQPRAVSPTASRSATQTNIANYGNQRATNLEQGRNPTRAPDAKSGKGRRTRRNRRK
jgi:hypothetical protein